MPSYYPTWCCTLLAWTLWRPYNELQEVSLTLGDESTTQMVLREVMWAYADHTNQSLRRLRLSLWVNDSTAPMVWGIVRTIGKLHGLRVLSLCIHGSLHNLTPTSPPSRGALQLDELHLDLARTGITPTGIRLLLQGLHGAKHLTLNVQGNSLSPWLGIQLGPGLGSWRSLETCHMILKDNPKCRLRPEWFGEHFRHPVQFHVVDDFGDEDLHSFRMDGDSLRCTLL